MVFSFLKNLFSKSIVAIDPGSINIKVVEGINKKGKVEIKNFGMASLSTTFTTDTSHIFEENLASILNKIITTAKITSKNFLFVVPANFSFFTDFTLPKISEKSLPNAIRFEAQRFVPFSLNDVILDYRYFLQELPGEEPKYFVFITTIPKNYIQRMQSVANLVKGKAVNFASEIFALEKYFLNQLTTNLVVNIGHGYTIFLGIYKGQVVYAQKSQLGGNILVSSLAQVLKVNKDRAILHLKERGFYFPPEEGEVSTIVDSFFNNLGRETKRVISTLEDKLVTRINQVFWTGGLTTLRGFLDKIRPNLSEYPQTILNPSDFVEGDKFKKLGEKSSIFSVCVGALI
jgi:type IV pilus assembly protein PilM